MLQIPFLRENLERAVKALKKRGIAAEKLVATAIERDEERRRLQREFDQNQSEAKNAAKMVGELFKAGKAEEAEEAKKRSAAFKEGNKKLQQQLDEAEKQLHQVLLDLPNIPYESVPPGQTEEDNEEVDRWETEVRLPDEALPHWELAKKYDLIDFESGVKITGSGFPVYTGKGARLQRALINYFLERNTAAGYRELQPPLFVNENSGYGTGQLPDKEGQMYHIGEDNLYAIPTAEVPVTNMFRDRILDEKDFPVLCTAYTPCFRREAGSYGKHVRGLNRLHQFDKVEIVCIERPEDSYRRLQTMCDQVGQLLRDLELPFRKLRLCGGDLGFAAAITYDFEVFSAAQKRWLEVSSVSNFEAFQANRMKIRYRTQEGKPALCHTLNGSALALPRVLAALLENNQTPEGIKIPEVLVPYTGFDIIT